MGVAEFERHCDANSLREILSVHPLNGNHFSLCRQIYNTPAVIGVRNVAKKWREVILQPRKLDAYKSDLVFSDHYGEFYLVECTTSRQGHNSNNWASNELKAEFHFVKETFQISPVLIRVIRRPGRGLEFKRIHPDVQDLIPY